MSTAETVVVPAAAQLSRAFEMAFEPDRAWVSRSRRITTAVLGLWKVGGAQAEDIVLIVSELVTNAIEHGEGGVGLRVQWSGSDVRIEVTDDNPAPARMRLSSDDDVSGRGLLLVTVLARRWGVTDDGRTTWATVRIASPPGPAASTTATEVGNRMTAIDGSTDRDPDVLRADMVRALRDEDGITTGPVAAAFATVPRHRFAPDASPEVAYSPHRTVPVKKDEHGMDISVMSAAHLQAVMLEQAEVESGMNVLEIGSGGVNAAYLQELVGSEGRVTTVDIDHDVIDRARRCLDDTGYGRVRTVLDDGEHGVADGAPFDRIIVTAAAWDIPPSWIGGLAEKGRLVVPLTVCGTTRSIGFDRDGSGLVSRSYGLAHFVPMQGEGAAEERKVMLREGVALQTDDVRVPLEPQALDAALDMPRLERWSGAAYDLPDELDLFLTLNLPSPARLHAAQDVVGSGLVEASALKGVPALVSRDSFAYRTRRENAATGGFESGVVAHGPQAEVLAGQYAYLLRHWAQNHRRRGAATFRYLPGPAPKPLPEGAVLRRHGIVAAIWT
jgi:protein-L-isoaspartate(D-aspartate) O-methyltransferase